MNNLIYLFLITLMLFVIMLTAKAVKAVEPMSVEEISMNPYSILFYRDSYLGNEHSYTKGIAADLNLRIFDYMKWNNRIYTNGTNGQVREVGWQFQVEVDLKYIAPFYMHHSRHRLDDGHPTDRFPLMDAVGIKFYFHRAPKKLWRD